jgi:membrane protease YdiL (CAAX protease family)
MSFLLEFHPRNFFDALREIDEEAAAERVSFTGPDYRAAITLFAAALCITFVEYLNSKSSIHGFLKVLSHLTGQPYGELFVALSASTFSGLAVYAWWCFYHLVGYVIIPVLVIKLILRDSVHNYGLGISRLPSYIKWCVFLAAIIVIVNVLLSSRKDFMNYYPFYRMAHRSWADLLAWESIYLLQFVFVEFFFRGFLLYGCRRAFGSNAIFVMCVPYMMIHFGKPWIEATGSLFIGIFLGVLVLRSRSIWGAVLVHWSIALSMDLLALLQAQGLPTRWWP